jgi:hypothetical protein
LLKNKWLWAVVGVFVGVLAFVLFQQNVSLFISSNRSTESTTIEASITTEGFRDSDVNGVRGQVCVSNTGSFPTENLSIVNTVQANNSSETKSIANTLNLGSNQVVEPGKSNCYPFEAAFELDSEQGVEYHTTTVITITNYTGFLIGSKYCRGPQPCPFGREITSDLVLPGQ